MAEGLDFLIPSSLIMKGALIDNQRSSNKFAASGNRSALRLPGSFRRRTTSWRPACEAGRTLRGALRADLLMSQEALLRRGRSCKYCICRKLMPDTAERGKVSWRYFILQLRLSDGAKENPS